MQKYACQAGGSCGPCPFYPFLCFSPRTFLLSWPLFVHSVLCQTALGHKTEVRAMSLLLGVLGRQRAELLSENFMHQIVFTCCPKFITPPSQWAPLFLLCTPGRLFFYFYLYNPFGYGPGLRRTPTRTRSSSSNFWG